LWCANRRQRDDDRQRQSEGEAEADSGVGRHGSRADERAQPGHSRVPTDVSAGTPKTFLISPEMVLEMVAADNAPAGSQQNYPARSRRVPAFPPVLLLPDNLGFAIGSAPIKWLPQC